VNIDEPITIEPYDPAWITHFASERAVLCRSLSIEPSRVEHIGSTSVVGMQTKPIVEIMLGLDSFPPLPTVCAKWRQTAALLTCSNGDLLPAGFYL
jgi:GrpB-like predicted nucleotidyltransferase (UPF0157 family)